MLVLLVTLAFSAYANGRIISGRATAVSGDTIVIDGEQIRLFDIDAPELDQRCFVSGTGEAWPCGEAAARALSEGLDQYTVTCETMGADYVGRWFARCSVATVSLATLIVANGWAVPNQGCQCEEVRAWSAFAKNEAAGIWSGKFAMPWEWRKNQ